MVEPAAGATNDDVDCFASRPVAALAAILDGRLPLHGAALDVDGGAVVVCGTATGTSTLAAALAARGHRLLADSVVVADATGGIFSSADEVLLWPDAAGALGLSGGRAVRPGVAVRRHRPACAATVEAGVAVRALVVLEVDGRLDSSAPRVAIEPLDAHQTVAGVLGSRWHGPVIEATDAEGRLFPCVVALARAPGWVLRRARYPLPAVLGELTEAVERLVR